MNCSPDFLLSAVGTARPRPLDSQALLPASGPRMLSFVCGGEDVPESRGGVLQDAELQSLGSRPARPSSSEGLAVLYASTSAREVVGPPPCWQLLRTPDSRWAARWRTEEEAEEPCPP